MTRRFGVCGLVAALLCSTARQTSAEDIVLAPAPRPLEQGCLDAPISHVSATSFTVQKPGEAPIRFSLSATLAAGKASDDREAHGVHRFADLMVGDHVFVEYRHAGGPKTCVVVKIQKRPGGLVPPATHNPRAKYAYHEYMNAYWDCKDRGIPMPDKFVAKFATDTTMFDDIPPAVAPPPRAKK